LQEETARGWDNATFAWLQHGTQGRLRENIRSAHKFGGVMQASSGGGQSGGFRISPPRAAGWDVFTVKVSAAYFAAMSCCTDDILWLMPFISQKSHTTRFAVFYLVCMLLTGLVSWSLVGGCTRLMEAFPSVPVELVLQIVSTAALAYYTVTLYLQWRSDRDDVATSAPGVAKHCGQASLQPLLGKAADAPPAEPQECDAPKRSRTFAELLSISFLGNLDNFAIYISMMVADVFGGLHLCIGCVLSGMTTVAICSGASQFQMIIDVVEFVPMWVILGALTILAIVELVA